MVEQSLSIFKMAFELGLSNLIHELTVLDSIIESFNRQLEKAQPLFSGRVVIKFVDTERFQLEGDFLYERKPCVGRMTKTRNGWRVLWVRQPDLTKLHEYRVGNGMAGDRVVVKLLKHLSEMLIRREEIVQSLKKSRTKILNDKQHIAYLHERKMSALLDIVPMITVDWTKDAKELSVLQAAKVLHSSAGGHRRIVNSALNGSIAP